MLTILATTALAALATAAPAPFQGRTDTTIAVPPGATLAVNNFGGAIVVRGWTQNRVKVHAEHGSRGRVEVALVGNTVTVRAAGRQGPPPVVDIEVTVPREMPLALSGTYAEIQVEGVRGPVSAETVNGSVDVRGGSGNITLEAIQGSITLADASGRIAVTAVNEDIELADVSGEIRIEGTNGDITLRRIKSANVDATTINGDVVYDGTIEDGGSYRFGSHNGDVTVSVPEGANVTLSVATANGDIDPSFPLPLTGAAGKRRYTFTLGTGSARMEVESFQGDVELRRPGEIRDPRSRKHGNKEEN